MPPTAKATAAKKNAIHHIPSSREETPSSDETAPGIPHDRRLIEELNAERIEPTKTGRIHNAHHEDTHDDRLLIPAPATRADAATHPQRTPRAT